MPHFDYTFRVADVLVICAALWVVGKLIAARIAQVFDEIFVRLDLHERALERAGWLRRNLKSGEFEVPAHNDVEPA